MVACPTNYVEGKKKKKKNRWVSQKYRVLELQKSMNILLIFKMIQESFNLIFNNVLVPNLFLFLCSDNSKGKGMYLTRTVARIIQLGVRVVWKLVFSNIACICWQKVELLILMQWDGSQRRCLPQSGRNFENVTEN